MSYCEVNTFVDISALVARVQMILPDVLDPIAEIIVRDQAIMFADNTKAFEVTVKEDAQENVPGYPVTLPGCLEPRLIREVRYNDVCYPRIQPSECSPDLSGCASGGGGNPCSGDKQSVGDFCTFAGAGFGYVAETTSWITLYPPPAEDGYNAITIVAVAGITSDACELPADMVNRWGAHIVNGALSILYAMKGEDWYSSANADRYAAMVKDGINDVKRDVAIALTGGEGIPITGDPWVL